MADRAHVNRPIEITIFAKTDGPLTKHIWLTKDGKLHSDGSACRMSHGEGRRLCVPGLRAFAAVIDSLKSNQAIALGALRDGLPDRVEITTKDKMNGDIGPNIIARTATDIVYESGRAALMLLDFDTKGMPAGVRSELQRLDGFWSALLSVIPGLQGTGRVSRRSTSAGLFRIDTGERLTGSEGEHHFVEVSDGSDAERALRTAHDRCWLAGLGWFMIGVSGNLLERSIVDRLVGTSERLVFEGAPIVVPPLAQDPELRRPQVYGGDAIDTITAIPPLTIGEAARLCEIKAKAKWALANEVAKARASYIASRAEQLAERTGTTIQAATHIVARQCDGSLLPDVVLPFDNEKLDGCTVGDVLADSVRFEGETLADPVEGLEYGRCCAKIMLEADGTPWIHSFAHGRTIYRLRYDAASVRKLLDQIADADVLNMLTRLDAQAEISETELEDLARYVKQRTSTGIRTILRNVRDARKQRAAQRMQEQRNRLLAERSDPRSRLDCPPVDAPWLPVMNTIFTIIAEAPTARRTKRGIEGLVAQPCRIVIPHTHAFSKEEDEP
jgi:hypothetical protein